MLDEFIDYLEKTPDEELKANWDSTKEYDKIGPTVEEYFDRLAELGIIDGSTDQNQSSEK